MAIKQQGITVLMHESNGYSARLLKMDNGHYRVEYSDGQVRESALYGTAERALKAFDEEAERVNREGLMCAQEDTAQLDT